MARLKKIEITNYRAFYENQVIPLAIPTGRTGSGLTVIVGPNNSGKSTVLDALLLVTPKKKVPKEERHGTDPIIVVLTDDQNDLKRISNEEVGGSPLKITGTSTLNEQSFEFIPSRRLWSPRFGGLQSITDYRAQSVRAGRSDNLDGQLGATLADIAQTKEKKDNFSKVVREMVPTFHDWSIETDSNGDYVEYHTKGGAVHQTNRFGDGLISLFRIIAHLMDVDKQKLLIIDEPELSLHPQGQRTLANLLAAHCTDRQILIATHSPHFVRWADLEAGAQIVRVAKRDDKKSEARHIPTVAGYKDKLLAMDEDWMKPQLLDSVAKELFFADNVVFVEGQEDVSLLRRFIDEENFPTNFEFFGYGCGGAGNIKTLLELARDLGLPSAALFDGDQKTEAKTCEEHFHDTLIKVLPTPDVRDKPKLIIRDDKTQTTGDIRKEGIFGGDGKLKEIYKGKLTKIIQDFVDFFDRPVT